MTRALGSGPATLVLSGEAGRPPLFLRIETQRPGAAVSRDQKATTNRTNYTNEKEETADDADARG